jgi:hypothetical protein
MKMASEPQVRYCRFLFRKVKFFYQCLNDTDLREAVLRRTGYDLDELEQYEAEEIIQKLTQDIRRQYKSDLWFLDYDRWLIREEDRQTVETICKPGDRIRLIHEPETIGTINHIDRVGTIHVEWDNGRKLGLIPGSDKFEILKECCDAG